MTTAIFATVLSVLSKPSRLLEAADSCIVDTINLKGSVNPVQRKITSTILSIDTNQSTKDAPSHKESYRHHLAKGSNVQLSEETASDQPTRQPPSSGRQDDCVWTISARTLRPRVEDLEEQCSLRRRKLRKLIHEATQDKSATSRTYRSSSYDGEIEAADVPFTPESRMIPRSKQPGKSARRSEDSYDEPLLPETSTRKRSRQRRALDLGISGTPKFRLTYDKITAKRPKLVKMRNRWCRVGGR